jgi:hypothetical protein
MATATKLMTLATLAFLSASRAVAQESKMAPASGIGTQITCGEYLAPVVSMARAIQIGEWIMGFWSGLDAMRLLEKKATVGAVGQDRLTESRELRRVCLEHPESGIPSAALKVWVGLLIAEGKK